MELDLCGAERDHAFTGSSFLREYVAETATVDRHRFKLLVIRAHAGILATQGRCRNELDEELAASPNTRARGIDHRVYGHRAKCQCFQREPRTF